MDLIEKFTTIHDRLTIKMNRCWQEADLLEWMTKERSPSSRRTQKKEPLLTFIDVLTHDVENTKDKNHGDLLLINKSWFVP